MFYHRYSARFCQITFTEGVSFVAYLMTCTVMLSAIIIVWVYNYYGHKKSRKDQIYFIKVQVANLHKIKQK